MKKSIKHISYNLIKRTDDILKDHETGLKNFESDIEINNFIDHMLKREDLSMGMGFYTVDINNLSILFDRLLETLDDIIKDQGL